jgi:hypothetical protein
MWDLKTHCLMPLLEGRKAIGSRWIFSVKSDEDGNVTRHKARFVAQGYTQVEGIDYTETFTAITKYNTVWILLALAAKFDLELDQMDIHCLNNRGSYIKSCKNVMTPQLHLNKTSCQSSINMVYDFFSFVVDNMWVLGRLAKSIW